MGARSERSLGAHDRSRDRAHREHGELRDGVAGDGERGRRPGARADALRVAAGSARATRDRRAGGGRPRGGRDPGRVARGATTGAFAARASDRAATSAERGSALGRRGARRDRSDRALARHATGRGRARRLRSRAAEAGGRPRHAWASASRSASPPRASWRLHAQDRAAREGDYVAAATALASLREGAATTSNEVLLDARLRSVEARVASNDTARSAAVRALRLSLADASRDRAATRTFQRRLDGIEGGDR